MFSVGTVITINLSGPGGKETCRSHLLGWKEGKYLIIDLPVVGGKPFFLHPQKEYVFRYLHEGCVVGFRSTVMGHVYTPYPMTLIRYPVDMERRFIRSAPRYPVRLKATFRCEGKEGEGTILDLSAKGCLLETRAVVPPRGFVAVSFRLPNQLESYYLTGMIRNTQPAGEEIRLGIAFHTTPASLEELIELIEQLSPPP